MKKIIIGLAIFFLAFFLRFNNLNWDSNFHLHPDERFLTMVGNAMKLPTNIDRYFDPKTSQLNPANVGYSFFVYGRFPLIITKYLAVGSNMDNYNDLTILGREISAFLDLMIVILIFKSVEILEKKYKFSEYVKYWAAFFYAIAVLPIQLSHFYATDTFLNFFIFGSFYFSLRRKNIFSAIFFGLALACKVTALYILPLNFLIIFLPYLKEPKKIFKYMAYLISYFLVSYIMLRLADPYIFKTANFFNPTIDPLFINNLKSLNAYANKNVWYPPAVQWINKKTLPFSITNLAVFGVGLPYFMFILVGLGWIISNIKNKNLDLQVVILWTLAFFIYEGMQFNPAMRYFLIIYPFLAIFAAIGINFFLEKIKNKKLFVICHLIFIISLLIWPVMFSSIYIHLNSRVTASEWIYKNLSNNSMILSESWDDGLPLPVTNTYGKAFTTDQLPVFDYDTPSKWEKMDSLLTKADYYILSSNRGWGSIPTVPEKYPLMSKFYNELLAGKNPSYKKIAEFTSYPSLKYLGIPVNFPDQWSDESFTVYDHQKVLIFKNTGK